jgi:hypothetical protein
MGVGPRRPSAHAKALLLYLDPPPFVHNRIPKFRIRLGVYIGEIDLGWQPYGSASSPIEPYTMEAPSFLLVECLEGANELLRLVVGLETVCLYETPALCRAYSLYLSLTPKRRRPSPEPFFFPTRQAGIPPFFLLPLRSASIYIYKRQASAPSTPER